MKFLSIVSIAAIAGISLSGCSGDKPNTDAKKPANVAKTDSLGHDHSGESGHADEGPKIELGSTSAGGFSIKAARDDGPIKPGGEAPCDVRITEGSAPIIAVRFWIGTEDASGSVKALAAIENPKDQSNWHTHVEIPNPVPDGSKLWVEIEIENGGETVASFELKASTRF